MLMKRIIEHIERAKDKPHHERKRLAFTWAGAGAGGIALVWFVASVSTGAFHIRDSSLSAGDAGITTSPSALSAAAGAASQSDARPAITIVDSPATTTALRPEPTTIPF